MPRRTKVRFTVDAISLLPRTVRLKFALISTDAHESVRMLAAIVLKNTLGTSWCRNKAPGMGGLGGLLAMVRTCVLFCSTRSEHALI